MVNITRIIRGRPAAGDMYESKGGNRAARSTRRGCPSGAARQALFATATASTRRIRPSASSRVFMLQAKEIRM